MIFKGIKDRYELLKEIAELKLEVKDLKKKFEEKKLHSKEKTKIYVNGHSVLYKDIKGEYNDIDLGI